MSKLLELQKEYGQKVDALEGLAEAGGEAYDSAMAEVKSLQEKIDRMKAAEALKATKAVPVTGSNTSPTVPAQAKAALALGTNLSRAIVALAATKGIPQFAAQFAEKTWGPEEGAVLARTLAVGTGSTGGFLVPEDFRQELIELLRPASVVLASGPRRIDMPNGNITLPRVVTGASAEYVGENQNMLKTGQTFGQVTLTAKKLAALVPMSNDMLRYPTMSADTFVRDDLVQALAQRGDLALIRGNGSVYSPKGLRQFAIEGVNQVITANATISVVNVTTDLAKMELALMNANLPMLRPGWLCSPRTYIFLLNLRDSNDHIVFPEMKEGKLRGKPIRYTTQIPDNIGGTSVGSELYLTEFSEFIVGESISLEIKVSEGGTYHDGTGLVSGLSQDQTIITALTAHDASMRQPAGVVMLDDVRWIP